MRLAIATGLAWVLSATALAQPAAQVAGSLQALNDAGETKEAAGDFAGALADYMAMEGRVVSQPASPNLALARMARARVLARLGRNDEALTALDAALAGGGLDRPQLLSNRIEALSSRGELRLSRWDHAGGAADYAAAAEIAQPGARQANALTGVARATMFTDPDRALAAIDRAAAIAATMRDLPRDQRSDMKALHGRVLLNRGDAEGARRLLQEAVSLRGGLTTSGTVGEFIVRSDAALANLRLGRDDDARRYLAYSGAGMATVPMPRPLAVALPPCGEDGIRPDDEVIVEFGIADDGKARYAQPIFSSRPGPHAYRFARAVAGWTYPPSTVAALPIYFRAGSRVGLRCTTTVARPRFTIAADDALGTWEAAQRFPELDVATLRSERELRRYLTNPARSDPERYAGYGALILTGSLSNDEVSRAWDQKLVAARRLDIPPAARVALEIRRASALSWQSTAARVAAERRLVALIEEPGIAADPALRAIVRMSAASGAEEAPERAMGWLQPVADDPALPALDPLKVAALTELANIHARAGRLDQAEAAYARTGLTAAQCALLEGTPRMRRLGNLTFPTSAQAWGFEGWTNVEFDVGADGRTTGVRTVAAYPPAVFADAAKAGVERTRYDIRYRPGGDPGCTGGSLNFAFRMTD